MKNNSILSHLDVFHVMDYNETMVEIRLGYEQVPANFSGEILQINSLCGDFAAESIDGNEHLIQCSDDINPLLVFNQRRSHLPSITKYFMENI